MNTDLYNRFHNASPETIGRDGWGACYARGYEGKKPSPSWKKYPRENFEKAMGAYQAGVDHLAEGK